ncbi:hypothetical protein IKG45_02460 [Candidatus Saccharibacteria bacterium]|nr:hypothetical protein [Candidatus Saccharibacteria bacterium]
MQDDSIPTWKMPPGSNPEIDSEKEREIPPEEDFSKSFENNVPPFSGEATEASLDNGSEFDEGMNDAARIMGYINGAPLGNESLDAVADVVMGIDGSSKDPIGELKTKLGFAEEDSEDVKAQHDKLMTSDFATNENASGAIDYAERTNADAMTAFNSALSSFKEWVSEVRGSDPKYAWAREKAMDAGVGVFDYLKQYTGAKGLADVFQILSTHEDEVEEISEDVKEEEEGKNSDTTDADTNALN